MSKQHFNYRILHIKHINSQIKDKITQIKDDMHHIYSRIQNMQYILSFEQVTQRDIIIALVLCKNRRTLKLIANHPKTILAEVFVLPTAPPPPEYKLHKIP